MHEETSYGFEPWPAAILSIDPYDEVLVDLIERFAGAHNDDGTIYWVETGSRLRELTNPYGHTGNYTRLTDILRQAQDEGYEEVCFIL